MSKSASIITIAKRVNMSHTTVSRALNNSPLVKESTKDKINRAAKELGYRTNFNAKALVSRKTFVIGIYLTELNLGTSPIFLSSIVNNVKFALPDGYTLSVDTIKNAQKDRVIENHKIDSALVVTQSIEDDNFIRLLEKEKFPAVILNRNIQKTGLINFSIDEYSGVVRILEYAIKLGHKNFGLIKGPGSFESSFFRSKAFFDTISKHNLKVPDYFVAVGDYSVGSGYRAAQQFINQKTLPSIIFSSNDDMAIGAMKAFNEFGLSFPKDISIIGFDDMKYSNFITPGLSTVRKPIGVLVKDGMDAIVKLLNKKDVKKTKKILEAAPIIRNSIMDLRK